MRVAGSSSRTIAVGLVASVADCRNVETVSQRELAVGDSITRDVSRLGADDRSAARSLVIALSRAGITDR